MFVVYFDKLSLRWKQAEDFLLLFPQQQVLMWIHHYSLHLSSLICSPSHLYYYSSPCQLQMLLPHYYHLHRLPQSLPHLHYPLSLLCPSYHHLTTKHYPLQFPPYYPIHHYSNNDLKNSFVPCSFPNFVALWI